MRSTRLPPCVVDLPYRWYVSRVRMSIMGANEQDLFQVPQQFNDTALQGGPLEQTSPGHYTAGDVDIVVEQPQPHRTFKRSYNIAPTSSAVIIYRAKADKPTYIMETLAFGLVPSWAKPTDPEAVQLKHKTAAPYSKEIQRYQGRQFNCRRESLGKGTALPTWSSHKRWTRCVVPILGYFEWLKSGNDKVPHFVHNRDAPLMYLAGLYLHNVHYKGDGDVYMSTFTIVTAPATKHDMRDMSWLHTRKPVVLVPGSKQWDEWLDPARDWTDSLIDTALETTATAAYNDVEAYVVDKIAAGSDGPQLIERRSKSPQKPITQFFTKRVKEEPEGSPKRVKRESPSILAALKGAGAKVEGPDTK